ncbi:MAG: type III-B CRISPR module RAMP protein Cmr6 [Acetomicrobium sp.]|jgi:CRISPR-associated protein Cmr6|uniref:type III-B CRISPR module RAMP protein Cmr6 n=1 Tax=Acetomicrobium sp. TaxID=1872099 RepID=UPI0016987754|nr:type III-B CRISPR module RAMP protein Cmr6 [Acetomicrobium sp.]MDR9769308.1 type III-B CRISPR module RAMP protein Cmr6 [Acetomicrobium sp.]NLI42205.1 type III-B CRISPR module RAMP protein Cmr6 [Synergistaceae bacterium]
MNKGSGNIINETNYKFYNPCETASILEKVIEKKGKYQECKGKKGGEKERIDWFYKSSQQTIINPALIFGRLIPSATGGDRNENKQKYLDMVIEENKKYKASGFYDLVLKRQRKWLEELKNSGWIVEDDLRKKTSWRLVVGLGSSHPQETSMTLHHVYGIPYIPGSAIKGMTRHWFILREFEKQNLSIEQIKCFEKILNEADFGNKEDEKTDKSTLKKFEEKFRVNNLKPHERLFEFVQKHPELINLYQGVFGTQRQKGGVIFFDSYPNGEINLKVDIMNPHYPEYYSGTQVPADWQQPNPIKFLTVENTTFCFSLASCDQFLLNSAKTLLEEALRNLGVGAKTSLGYGILDDMF